MSQNKTIWRALLIFLLFSLASNANTFHQNDWSFLFDRKLNVTSFKSACESSMIVKVDIDKKRKKVSTRVNSFGLGSDCHGSALSYYESHGVYTIGDNDLSGSRKLYVKFLNSNYVQKTQSLLDPLFPCISDKKCIFSKMLRKELPLIRRNFQKTNDGFYVKVKGLGDIKLYRIREGK